MGLEALDRYMPRIKAQTPKGSIVALDYEDGASGNMAANTDAILAGMRRIQAEGYTPMYYSYKPYTLAHVDYQRILKEFLTAFGLLLTVIIYQLPNQTTVIFRVWMG